MPAHRADLDRTCLEDACEPLLPAAPRVPFVAVSMLSLRALLDSHASLLVIDTASARIQVGLLRRGIEPVWESAAEEAGTALFSSVEKLLARSARESHPAAPFSLGAIEAFAFCDGPGSVLGIRTAAVALRVWSGLMPRPHYSFCSLELVARALVLTEHARDFTVIADARRETWHTIAVDREGTLSPLRREPGRALSGDLVMPDGFRHWSCLPPATRKTACVVEAMLRATIDEPLFTPAPAPDAFLHEEPAYQTWTPQVHRAPA